MYRAQISRRQLEELAGRITFVHHEHDVGGVKGIDRLHRDVLGITGADPGHGHRPRSDLLASFVCRLGSVR